MEEYKPGHIKRIKINNFMTYDDVEFFPRSGLNLIIGLNGSGKSSIMCAICLGLAGKPQFTGRATQLADFIKHGQTEATIELELCKDAEENVVIQRIIKLVRSTWRLNNSPASQSEVLEVVKKFNIDTGNLCQFLPQEKVAEFSKMDKKQRLENMLQAIGEPGLNELYAELRDLQRQFCVLEKQIKTFKREKAENEEKNLLLKPDIDKQNQREHLKSELKLLMDQRKLLEYQILRDDVEEKKKVKNQHKRAREKYAVESEEILTKKDEIVKRLTEKLLLAQNLGEECFTLFSKIQLNIKYLTELDEKTHNEKIELINLAAERENQKERVCNLEKQIKELKVELLDAKLSEETACRLSKEYEELEKEKLQIFQNLQQIRAANNKHFTDTIALEVQIQGEEEKVLERLKTLSLPTYEAICWVKENKKLFKATVYTPIMLQIKVDEDENRKFIEDAIPNRDLLAFVCEDKEDATLLSKVLLTEKQLQVNIVIAPDQPPSSFPSPKVTINDKNCGFKFFLKDLFTAPDPVMSYLCRCFYVHRIRICSTEAEKNMEYFLQKFQKFYSPEYKISGRRSKYGEKSWSFMRDKLREGKFLVSSNDKLNQLRKSLSEAKEICRNGEKKDQELCACLEEIEICMDKKLQAKKYLGDCREKSKEVEIILEQKQSILQSINALIDENSTKCTIMETITELIDRKSRIIQKQRIVLSEYLRVKKEEIHAVIACNLVSRLMNGIEDKAKEAESTLQKYIDLYKDSETEFYESFKKAKAKYEEIKPLIGMITFQHMSHDINEVDQKIIEVNALLNMGCDVNSEIIQQYQKCLLKIETTEKNNEKFEEALQVTENKINEKRTLWLNPLRNHIQNINKRFSQYFKFLNCAGEISLDASDDLNDFDNYGLLIKLKYREDEPFTELSQTHHSGGECSVAAIIFILSLQELTQVPFRCIDEINQGMDAVNERKIYQLVSESASSGSCSQYFLLTPKLLMDLTYPKNVAVHFIYNSCFLDMKLDIKQHLQQEIKQCT